MSSYMPSRKWFAQLVGGFTPVVLSAIDSGWDKTESKMSVVLLSAAILSYLIPNREQK